MTTKKRLTKKQQQERLRHHAAVNAHLMAYHATHKRSRVHWFVKAVLFLAFVAGVVAAVVVGYRVWYLEEDPFVPPTPPGGTGVPGITDPPDSGDTPGLDDTPVLEKGRHWLVVAFVGLAVVGIVYDLLEIAVKREDPLFFSRFPDFFEKREYILKGIHLLVACIAFIVITVVLLGEGNVSKTEMTVVATLYGVLLLTSLGSSIVPMNFSRRTKKGEKRIEFWPQSHFDDNLWTREVKRGGAFHSIGMKRGAKEAFDSQKEHLLRGMEMIDKMAGLPKEQRRPIRFFTENIMGDTERHVTDKTKHKKSYKRVIGKMLVDAKDRKVFSPRKESNRALVVYGAGPFIEAYAKKKGVKFSLHQTMDEKGREWLLHHISQLDEYQAWLEKRWPAEEGSTKENPIRNSLVRYLRKRGFEEDGAPFLFDDEFDHIAREMREAMVVWRLRQDREEHPDAKTVLQFGMNHTFTAWNLVDTKIVFKRITFASQSVLTRLGQVIRGVEPYEGAFSKYVEEGGKLVFDKNGDAKMELLPLWDRIKYVFFGEAVGKAEESDIREHGQKLRKLDDRSVGYLQTFQREKFAYVK